VVPLDLHYTAQERDTALSQGIGFAQDLKFTEDTAAIRLIVYDRNSHAIGSITLPAPR